jgi:hypothetical protein
VSASVLWTAVSYTDSFVDWASACESESLSRWEDDLKVKRSEAGQRHVDNGHVSKAVEPKRREIRLTVEDSRVLSCWIVEEVALLLLPSSVLFALAKLAKRTVPRASILAVLEQVLFLDLGKPKEYADTIVEICTRKGRRRRRIVNVWPRRASKGKGSGNARHSQTASAWAGPFARMGMKAGRGLDVVGEVGDMSGGGATRMLWVRAFGPGGEVASVWWVEGEDEMDCSC